MPREALGSFREACTAVEAGREASRRERVSAPLARRMTVPSVDRPTDSRIMTPPCQREDLE
jgi:hypothetical protein